MAAGGNPSSRSSKDLSDSSDKPADAPMAATGTADASGFADGALVNGLNDSLDAGKSEAGKPSILFGRDSASPRQQATQAPAAEGKIASSKSDVYPEKAETASRLRKAGTSENAPAVFAGDDVSNLSESDKATRAELRSRVDAAWELSVPKDQDAELVLKDKYWDTSFVEKPREKDRSGSTEYELHTGFSSKYLFRGMDLNPKDGSKPAAADLAELMEEIPAAENPYSTFSLNISDASFQLAKAALAKGERPDPASIKPEQFYNAVDYGDPAPMSNEPVAATIEQSAHPVIPGRNLVRVALRTGSTGRSAAQPLRLTLLVDQSGSMVREDRRASMDHALAQLGVLLTKNDQVTVIGFSRTPHLLAEALTGDEAGKLGELVNQTASEGGTNLEEALRLGAEKAASHKLAGAQNRVVLFTDGAANLGDADPARLAEQVKSLRQKGIAFDVAGIGADGLNDRLLSDMARNGNGRYYIVGDEKNDSFARQLAGAFRPAAENVKVQVNFNPRRVGKYRLLGFEKDRLKTEDFRNDAVDAAELAAEEAGVAIYQVEPLADGTGELGEVSVRFRDAAGGEMVERSWTISYDAQASAFDRATPSMQLAGLSLLAAEKLRGGPLGDAIDFKQHAGSAASVKQFYGSSPRVADMLQVIEKLK
jgi:Mg-chelatase subunit ChlD